MWGCSCKIGAPGYKDPNTTDNERGKYKALEDTQARELARADVAAVDEPPPETGETVKAALALEWLLLADEALVLEALQRIAQVRPHLLARAATDAGIKGMSPHPQQSPSPRSSGDSTVAPPSLRFLPNCTREVRETVPLDDNDRTLAAAERRVEAERRQELRRQAAIPDANQGCEEIQDWPFVQFSANTYYADEDKEQIVLQVVRFGNISQMSRVDFETHSGSAVAGERFEHTEGTIVFHKGENVKEVHVTLIGDDRWDTTTEFTVQLKEEGIFCARVGSKHVSTARVKIIDDDVFPSNKYKDQILARQIDDVPQLSLLMEYIKFNTGFQRVRERSIRIIMLGVAHNAVFLSHLFINLYLVDYVLNPHCPDEDLFLVHSKKLSLSLVVIIVIVPFALLHYVDHQKVSYFGVGGPSRSALQMGLFRKFLELDHNSRNDLPRTDLINAMTSDSTDLVEGGYGSMLHVVKEFGELAAMLLYQFLAPVFFDKPFSWIGFLPLVLFPPVMGVWVYMRTHSTSECLTGQNKAFKRMLQVVSQVVDNYNLIAGYDKRKDFGDGFENDVKDYNAATRKANVVLNTNSYFALWLSTIVGVAWMVIGGYKVLDGTLSLGMFMTNLSIFHKIGNAWVQIYHIGMEMNKVCPCLERITVLMNLPTDLVTQQCLLEDFHDQASEFQVEATKQLGSVVPYVDRMPFRVGNLGFGYHTKSDKKNKNGDHDVRVKTLQFRGMLEVMQGEFVVLVGPKGSGKLTLLKLLGGTFFPSLDLLRKSREAKVPSIANDGSSKEAKDEDDTSNDGPGQFLVPAHLSLLHVAEPMFTSGTLRDNLLFGIKEEGSAISSDMRVFNICRRLGITDDVLDHIDTSLPWADVLSQNQAQLVSLARALIADPEVLCLHKPTQVFGDGLSKAVSACLREYVQNSGFEVDPASRIRRRPRTCIMTSSNFNDMQHADRVVHVSGNGWLETLPCPSGPEDFDEMTH